MDTIKNNDSSARKKTYYLKLEHWLDRLIKGFFRASFLVAIVCSLLGAFVWAPYSGSSIQINFTYKEKEQFKEDLLKKYSWLRQRPETLNKDADNIIGYYYGHHQGKVERLLTLTTPISGDREGKASLYCGYEVIDAAVNRTIDKYNHINFSGGRVVNNKSHGLTGFYFDEDGYSIVPGFKEKFFTSLDCAWRAALISWIIVAGFLPIFLSFLFLFLRFLGFVFPLFLRNVKWISKGFSKQN